METITLNYLKQHDACEEGVQFFKGGNLEGFPLEKLKEVKGDFNNFVSWIKNRPEYEYNSQGLMTKKVFSNGDTYSYEYNSQGLMTKKVFPNGNTYSCKYGFHKSGSLAFVKRDGKLVLEIPEFK